MPYSGLPTFFLSQGTIPVASWHQTCCVGPPPPPCQPPLCTALFLTQAEEIDARGWVAVVFNQRGCGASELTSSRMYCLAASWDCADVLAHLRRCGLVSGPHGCFPSSLTVPTCCQINVGHSLFCSLSLFVHFHKLGLIFCVYF